jgi:hypothetical protein
MWDEWEEQVSYTISALTHKKKKDLKHNTELPLLPIFLIML